MTPVEKLLPRLDKVIERGGNRWMARCPSHEDGAPSLSVEVSDDGTLLVHCFAGCAAGEIMSAVDLSLADLFPQPFTHKPTKPRWTVKDLLLALSREFDVVLLAAGDIVAGKSLSQDDVDRVAAAVRRVQRIKEICRVG